MPKQHSNSSRSSYNKGQFSKDRPHNMPASVVKLVNTAQVTNQSDLLHLVANTIKRHSRNTTNLVAMQAGKDSMTYQVMGKILAVKLGKAVAAAFKHYHPVVTITDTKQPDACLVTVTFA